MDVKISETFICGHVEGIKNFQVYESLNQKSNLSTVLCKSNANKFRQNSWLFEEISLHAIFARQIVIVRCIFAIPIVWSGP